jgi:site-specific DNA-methyltransferase (adenine-specific)
VVRVEPFQYNGKVWCLRVPTGAFVAARNGMAFPTGNSGFPKSQDVSKAIDKAGGISPERQAATLRSKREKASMSREHLAKAVGCTEASIRDWEEGRARAAGASVEHIVPSQEYRKKLAEVLGYTSDERKLVGVAVDRRKDGSVCALGHSGELRAGGNTDQAKRFNGYGTALKPAYEPVLLCRKPLEGTVAANCLKHGTGALNIDGCRVGDFQNTTPSGVDRRNAKLCEMGYRPREYQQGEKTPESPQGRFPANLIHDNSDQVLACFPEAKSGKANGDATIGEEGANTPLRRGKLTPRSDSGSAARFFQSCPDDDPEDEETRQRLFYCAKASKKDRGADNKHPTVKPTALMQYLCKLAAPPPADDGTPPVILDPFMGSGSTGKAAMLEGFRFIGIEREKEYFDIAEARILSV